MKLSTHTQDEMKNVVKNTSTQTQKALAERDEIATQLKDLAPGAFLVILPETKEIKKRDGKVESKTETLRGIRLRITRAAIDNGIEDVQYGTHKDGGLAVWRDATSAKKARRNGKSEPAVAAV